MKFFLSCNKCNFRSDNNFNILYCPNCKESALLKTNYYKNLNVEATNNDFYSFIEWLPFEKKHFSGNICINCFKSQRLNQFLGLKDLWILFSGYSKRYGSSLYTCTFKETEAIGVLSRIIEGTDKTLIISSAGNAAKAFLEYGIQIQKKIVVIIPENALKDIKVISKPKRVAPLLICIKDSAYMDAIRLVNKMIERFPYDLVREGGCYNVARRDSMAVPFLRSAIKMNSIPNRYIQAVGSGTGALAAWEASKRLISIPSIEKRSMKLHLIQNFPFQPIVDAWNSNSKSIRKIKDSEVYKLLSNTKAKVLSNTNPPYSVSGGLYDALMESNGETTAVNNQEIEEARNLAFNILDLDLCSPASAALAGLVKSLNDNKIDKNEKILLHLTGGGSSQIRKDMSLIDYPFVKKIDLNDFRKAEILIKEYLSNN